MPYYPPAGGGSGYSLVENEGAPLTARTTLDFVGAGRHPRQTPGSLPR